MRSLSVRSFVLLSILLVVAGASLSAQVVFTYNNFTAPTTNLQANGNAASVGSVMRLTPALAAQSGSVWYYGGTAAAPLPVPLVNGFTTSFQFQISGSNAPADGIAFVIQNGAFPQNPAGGCPAQNGSSGISAFEAPDINCGGDIGYTGLTNSVAIEFDDFQNPWDLDANHVAIQSCGSSPNTSNHNTACLIARTGMGALKTVIADGNPHTVVVKYSPPGCSGEICTNPNNLQVYLDGNLVLAATFDLGTLGLDANQDAFVGFVARTGAADANQDILSWSFSTTLPPAPANQGSTVTATFNSTEGNLVQEVVDLTSTNITPVPGATQTEMQVSNQAIVPSAWQPTWVPGTPFATSSCWPHTGEGNNCKLYIDLCTNNSGAPGSTTPMGANCPTSNPPSIGVTDNFNGPKIDPNSLGANVGFGLLEAPDNWQGGPCQFTAPSSAAGEPCPMNVLTKLTGDPAPHSSTVPHFNSTFIAIYGVPQPGTSIAVTPGVNGNGWINNGSVANPSVSANFTTSTQPPPVPNPNSYVQPNVAQVTYQLTDTANPPNTIASGTLTPQVPAPTYTSGPVILGSLPDGHYLLNYQGQDDHGTRELVFTLANNVYSTSGKVLPVNIDTTKPTESVTLTSSNVFLNRPDTANYSCGDALSGVVACGAQVYNPAVPNTPVVATPLNTSTPGPHAFSVTATDAAGNTSTTQVQYNVTYQFFGFVPEIFFPGINKVKAGIVIPAGFLLTDGNFKPITNLRSIAVTGFASTNCTGANPTPVAITGTLLNFGYGIYDYNWKTSTSFAGQCITFQANLGDGVIHRLNFQFVPGGH